VTFQMPKGVAAKVGSDAEAIGRRLMEQAAELNPLNLAQALAALRLANAWIHTPDPVRTITSLRRRNAGVQGGSK
jgi:hypothetical protein